MSFEMTKYI
ncbi:hypothetical protein V2J09_004371 [Rumex salicifolius]